MNPNTFSQDDLPPALEHLAQGRHEQAIALLAECIRRDPGRLAAVRALAAAFVASGRPDDARKTLSDYTAAQPMCEQGWRLAALLDWKLAQRPAAIAVLRRGLARIPRSQVLARQLELFAAVENGGEELPVVSCQLPVTPAAASVESETPSPDFLDRLVQDPRLIEGILDASDQPDPEMLGLVEERLSRLVDAQPGHPDRQVILARVRLRLGDLGGAMSAIQKALAANPTYIQAHRLRAEVAARMGDDAQAVQALESLVARGLAWPDLHCQIAQIHHRHGRNERARAHLWQALRAAPNYQKAHELLARCA